MSHRRPTKPAHRRIARTPTHTPTRAHADAHAGDRDVAPAQIARLARLAWCACLLVAVGGTVRADENLFGYVKGAEPLPRGAVEVYQTLTSRTDKGAGHYGALDSETEVEYGFTDQLSGYAGFRAMAIDTHDLRIDGYLPADRDTGLRVAGIEAALKYNFLSPARAPLGVATVFELSLGRLDRHSGQDKDTISIEHLLLLQRYLLDGRLILVANVGYEATRARRFPIADLPAGFDWPTTPEMELALKLGFGVSYRFRPGWFLGAEAFHDREYETEVGLERWSWQAGPTLHYGGRRWWTTLTWLPQLEGGGESYAGQTDTNLHLVEKTKHELRFKLGFNF